MFMWKEIHAKDPASVKPKLIGKVFYQLLLLPNLSEALQRNGDMNARQLLMPGVGVVVFYSRGFTFGAYNG